MSIDRRSALVLIGAAAWAAKGDAFGAPVADSLAWFTDNDSSVADVLHRLGKHVYSEDGVPMFLACENVVGPGSQATAVEHGLPSNEKIAAAFERYAGQWQQEHPRASAGDVAKIVEVLAERDFAAGGLETSL